jgi:hypothetical protein
MKERSPRQNDNPVHRAISVARRPISRSTFTPHYLKRLQPAPRAIMPPADHPVMGSTGHRVPASDSLDYASSPSTTPNDQKTKYQKPNDEIKRSMTTK